MLKFALVHVCCRQEKISVVFSFMCVTMSTNFHFITWQQYPVKNNWCYVCVCVWEREREREREGGREGRRGRDRGREGERGKERERERHTSILDAPEMLLSLAFLMQFSMYSITFLSSLASVTAETLSISHTHTHTHHQLSPFTHYPPITHHHSHLITYHMTIYRRSHVHVHVHLYVAVNHTYITYSSNKI